MTRYQLLEGQHIEPSPDDDKGIKIERGQFFESANDWYAQRWPEKFALADKRLLSQNQHVWDEQRETLEQFNERMRRVKMAPLPVPSAAPIQQQATNPVSSPSSKKISNLEEEMMALLESLSVKELQAHAAEEKYDLKGATKREDILRIIKSQLSAPIAV